MTGKRKVVLYIATSLDGYIARENGDIDWLPGDPGQDFGYSEFYSTIDTVLIGRKTFEQALSFGEFPYPDKTCFVFSRGTPFEHPAVETVSGNIPSFVRKLQAREGKSIWLVGGAELIHEFVTHDLIDEYIISVLPVLLGSGIPLFHKRSGDIPLQLERTVTFPSGLMQMHCARKR